jgi:hypothetical protein
VEGYLGGDDEDVHQVGLLIREDDVAGLLAALGDEITDGEVLGGEDLIESGKREAAAGVKEVGEMRLAESGLSREQGDAHGSAFDSAEQLGAHALLQLGEVHVENS